MVPNIKSRKLQLFFLCFLSALSYGMDLETAISEYEKKSYTTKINETNLKTYDIKDKALKKGSWNEVSISSQNTYENSHTYDGISTDNTIKYGLFY